jgi:hypothetical protein
LLTRVFVNDLHLASLYGHSILNTLGVNLPNPAYAPQPNETFNADANIGHRFAILMANVGTLRPYRVFGAG